MGFLKRILRSGVAEDSIKGGSSGSFESLSDDELQTHMGIDSYGVFDLTDAIRPSYRLSQNRDFGTTNTLMKPTEPALLSSWHQPRGTRCWICFLT